MVSKNEEATAALWRKLESITPGLFQDFLLQKGIPVIQCPFCHKSEMSIPLMTRVEIGPPGSKYTEPFTYINPTTKGSEGKNSSSPYDYEYDLFCKNCGFVSKFSVFPVLKWLAENEKNGVDYEQ